jgi:hypothetical protein
MRSRHHRQSRRVAQREGQWVQSITCKAEDAGKSAKAGKLEGCSSGTWMGGRIGSDSATKALKSTIPSGHGAYKRDLLLVSPDGFANVLAMCVTYGTGPREVEVELS